MFRYLILAWAASDAEASPQLDALVQRVYDSIPDMRLAFSARGVVVFTAGARAGSSPCYLVANGAGIILGKLFSKAVDEHTPPQEVALDERASTALVASEGRRLIEEYWGRYVALIHDETRHMSWVIRDPSGGLPCFRTRHERITLLFSWTTDFVALRLRHPVIDFKYLAALAAEFPLQGHMTGIEGVTELLMGECVELRAGAVAQTRTYWDPVRFAREPITENLDTAVALARGRVLACVGAWASCYPSIVHQLSGGLDSTIIAACLARSPTKPRVHCANYYLEGSRGDERLYARLAASRTGYELSEIAMDPAAVPAEAIESFAATVSPMPGAEAFYNQRGIERVAQEHGSAAVFNGSFGDSLFFYYSTPTLMIADYMHRHGPFAAGLLSTIVQTAAWERRAIGSVFWEAAGYGVLRRRYKPLDYVGKWRWFTTPRAVEIARSTEDFVPPYLKTNPRIAPGKVEQMVGLAFAPQYYNPVSRSDSPEPVAVLTSQPLRELFFSIPNDILNYRGQPRAIARRAFGADIPPEILNRRTKGTVNDFFTRFASINRQYLKTLLLDGELVQQGILDRAKLEKYFRRGQYMDARLTTEIALWHFALEAWARKWKSEMTRVRRPERSTASLHISAAMAHRVMGH